MDLVARASSERGELVLRRRDDGHLELRANGVFVMDTAEHTSERALATEAVRRAGDRPLRVLVGGLGLGFTLAAVLDHAQVSACTVVEIEPDLVGWLRNGTVPHGPALLADPRVTVRIGDVAAELRSAEATYDLVLLDVDNGPGHLVHQHNAGLYAARSLDEARAALVVGGLLVIWSAAPAPELEASLREVFDTVEPQRHAAPGHGRVSDYFLYLARR